MAEQDLDYFERYAEKLFSATLPQAQRYYELLANEGITWGLLGPREVPILWQRHILPSAALTRIISTGSVIDIGSGAGLPGIPLALANPNISVTLLEPMARRVAFLELAITELGLKNQVQVLRARAEDTTQKYDFVISRAVAALPKLLGWCLPLLADNGKIVAVKGASAAKEISGAKRQLRGKLAQVIDLPLDPLMESVFFDENSKSTSQEDIEEGYTRVIVVKSIRR